MNKHVWESITLVAIATLLLFSPHPAQAGSLSNWEFVYQNDENGNPVNGDINILVEAISEGADVRVVGCGTNFLSYRPSIVSVDQDSETPVVTANITKYNALPIYDASGEMVDNEDLIHKRVSLSSDGTLVVLWGKNERFGGMQKSTACLKWFVNR